MSDLYYIFNGIKNTMELVNSKRSGYDYLTVNGAHALLLPAYDSSHTTKMWVSRNGGTTKKYVAIHQTFNVTINQSANQTITVNCNGQNYTSSFTARYGDAFSISITGNNGYTAGGVNVSSGNVYNDFTVYATSSAQLVVAGNITYTTPGTKGYTENLFTVPAHANVLAVYSNAWSGSRNIAVTAGKQYYVCVSTWYGSTSDKSSVTYVYIGTTKSVVNQYEIIYMSTYGNMSAHTSNPDPLWIRLEWSDTINTWGTSYNAN